jgi:hypothetical protein
MSLEKVISISIILAFALFIVNLLDISFSQTYIIEINVSDVKPKVLTMTVSEDPFDPAEAQSKKIAIWADVMDPDQGASGLDRCWGYLWNSSTTPATPGNARYRNSSCDFVVVGSYKRCNCTFDIWYYDAPTTWRVNLTANDTDGNTGFNSTTFLVNALEAFDPYVGITFPSPLFMGETSAADTNPHIINNTGNVRLRSYINASDFTGETDPSWTIKIENMTYNSSATGMGTLQQMRNLLTEFNPTGGIPVYPNQTAGIPDPGTFNIYYYMYIPTGIMEQLYNTTHWLSVTVY